MIKIVNRSKGFGSKSNESKKSLRSKIESARLLKALKERRLEALKSRRLEAKKNERLDRLKKMVARKQNEKKAINRRTKKNEGVGSGYSIDFELSSAPQVKEIKKWDYELEEHRYGIVAHFNVLVDTYTLDFDWIRTVHPDWSLPLEDDSFDVTDAYFEDLEVLFTIPLHTLLSEEDLEELDSVREDIEFTDSNSKYMKMLRSKIREVFDYEGKTLVNHELDSMFSPNLFGVMKIPYGWGWDHVSLVDKIELSPKQNNDNPEGFLVSPELAEAFNAEHDFMMQDQEDKNEDEDYEE